MIGSDFWRDFPRFRSAPLGVWTVCFWTQGCFTMGLAFPCKMCESNITHQSIVKWMNLKLWWIILKPAVIRNPCAEMLGSAYSLVTGRIIPFRKWLITMISKSPMWGCSPSQWPKWLMNGPYQILTRWDDPPSKQISELSRAWNAWSISNNIFDRCPAQEPTKGEFLPVACRVRKNYKTSRSDRLDGCHKCF